MKPTRSKWWPALVDILEKNFPKRQCKERGQALVMLAEVELLLRNEPLKGENWPLKEIRRDVQELLWRIDELLKNENPR